MAIDVRQQCAVCVDMIMNNQGGMFRHQVANFTVISLMSLRDHTMPGKFRDFPNEQDMTCKNNFHTKHLTGDSVRHIKPKIYLMDK